MSAKRYNTPNRIVAIKSCRRGEERGRNQREESEGGIRGRKRRKRKEREKRGEGRKEGEGKGERGGKEDKGKGGRRGEQERGEGKGGGDKAVVALHLSRTTNNLPRQQAT